MKFPVVILAILVVVGIFKFADYVTDFPFGKDDVNAENGNQVTNIEPKVLAKFKQDLEAKVISERGQPIEGFKPDMLRREWDGLTEKDFHGVTAALGVYQFLNSKLVFVRDESKPEHSAARAITDEGYAILLSNVATRLGVNAKTEADGQAIINALMGDKQTDVGTIRGMLTIGPICPVEREGVPCPVPRAAYEARPIIAKDNSGKIVQRVVATDNGTYELKILPGTYTITVETASSIEHAEEKKVEVKGGEVIQDINFDIDTGIR